MMVKSQTVFYTAVGKAIGKLWGDAMLATYDSICYKADSLEELKKQINEGIKSQTIDSGFGFEEVVGAIMSLKIIRSIEYEGRIYTNIEIDKKPLLFGDSSLITGFLSVIEEEGRF